MEENFPSDLLLAGEEGEPGDAPEVDAASLAIALGGSERHSVAAATALDVQLVGMPAAVGGAAGLGVVDPETEGKGRAGVFDLKDEGLAPAPVLSSRPVGDAAVDAAVDPDAQGRRPLRSGFPGQRGLSLGSPNPTAGGPVESADLREAGLVPRLAEAKKGGRGERDDETGDDEEPEGSEAAGRPTRSPDEPEGGDPGTEGVEEEVAEGGMAPEPALGDLGGTAEGNRESEGEGGAALNPEARRQQRGEAEGGEGEAGKVAKVEQGAAPRVRPGPDAGGKKERGEEPEHREGGDPKKASGRGMEGGRHSVVCLGHKRDWSMNLRENLQKRTKLGD